MPDQDEISKLRDDIATTFAFDIGGIKEDADSIRSHIQQIKNKLEENKRNGSKTPIDDELPINSLDIYLQSLSRRAVQTEIPNLENFVYSEIDEDKTLRDRLIEQNFESALYYLRNCISLRREYGDIAKLQLDTKMKIEEFFRLDDIHKQEVEEGLYKLPYLDAKDEQEAAVSASAAADLQVKKADEHWHLVENVYAEVSDANIYYGSLNPKTKRNWPISYQIEIAQRSSPSNPEKAELGEVTRRLGVYRQNLEDASWQSTRKTVEASVEASKISQAEWAARLSIATRKSEYLYKDVLFRTRRAAMSRQLAYVQLYEHRREGSILNYRERLTATHSLFDLSARTLVKRVKALHRALGPLYDIHEALDTPKQGTTIDKIAEWLLRVREQIQKYHSKQRVSIFSISLKQLLDRKAEELPNLLSAGLKIDISVHDTKDQSGLARGIAFEYIGTGAVVKPITLSVSPPPGATDNVGGGGPAISPLTFGRVLPVAPALDVRPQQSDAIWNGNPYGIWHIACEKEETAGIQDIIMYLWLAY